MNKLDKIVTKITNHEFPKLEGCYVTWKYKIIYFEDGTIILKGLYI